MPKSERSEYIFKILGDGFLIILFATLQIGFLAAMPWPINYFNLVLAVVVFITFALSYHRGLWFALFIGLILDLFSFTGFGAMTLALLLTVVFINTLFSNFFTNRSFYSLIFLGFLGNLVYILATLLFNLFFFVIGATNNLNRFFTAPNIFGLIWQIFFSIVSLAALFLIFNFLSKKLKSVFY